MSLLALNAQMVKLFSPIRISSALHSSNTGAADEGANGLDTAWKEAVAFNVSGPEYVAAMDSVSESLHPSM